jgi:hypothetical protein
MILSFDKPKKIRSTEDHNRTFSSDSGVEGTYVPNMSPADQERWKGKHIKNGDDPRVEIRKSLTNGTQILLVVRADGVTMSANGKMVFPWSTWSELLGAVYEARVLLGIEKSDVLHLLDDATEKLLSAKYGEASEYATGREDEAHRNGEAEREVNEIRRQAGLPDLGATLKCPWDKGLGLCMVRAAADGNAADADAGNGHCKGCDRQFMSYAEPRRIAHHLRQQQR